MLTDRSLGRRIMSQRHRARCWETIWEIPDKTVDGLPTARIRFNGDERRAPHLAERGEAPVQRPLLPDVQSKSP